MKLVRPVVVIALLVCAFAAPAYAQQSQSGDSAEQNQTSNARDRRSFTGGRFTMDLAGHNAGFIDKTEDETQTPTIQNRGALTAPVVRPLVAGRPGAVQVAPVTDDKDGDDD